jgi:hypothetical protein
MISWLVTAAMISLASAGPIFAQIKPYLKNPSYWQYDGQIQAYFWKTSVAL